jgi:hypothetical protein
MGPAGFSKHGYVLNQRKYNRLVGGILSNPSLLLVIGMTFRLKVS